MTPNTGHLSADEYSLIADEATRLTWRYQVNPALLTTKFGEEYNLSLPVEGDLPFVLTLTKYEMYSLMLAIQGKDHRSIYDSIRQILDTNLTYEEFDASILELLRRMRAYGIISKDNMPFNKTPVVRPPAILPQIYRSPFFFKIPIWNPNKFLEAIQPYFGWIYFPEWIVVFLFASTLAILSFFASEAKMEAELAWYQEFYSVTNVLIITFILLISKIPHEVLGHGLAMKWINRNVYEMGIGFLVGTPCLYCDITEIYLEPKRSNRILVSLAGVYIDIIVTGIASVIFLISPPGSISTIARMLVFANIGYTMFVNLIPLTKFDGHYALASAWGRQNLGFDAKEYVGELLRLMFLNDDTSGHEDAQSDRFVLALFGVCAWFYKWFLVFGITTSMYYFGEQIGLGLLTGSFAAFLMIGLNRTILSAWENTNIRTTRIKGNTEE
jgi:hypothetical protein